MGLRQQTGVAAVEFTIMLPVLLLLVFATAELGRALYQYSHLTRMVRDAGRYLSTKAISNTTENLPNPLNDASCGNCISNTKDLLVYGKVGGTIPLLYGLDASDVTIIGDSVTDRVIITVDYDWQPLFGEQISGFGLGDSTDLSFNFHVSYAMRAGL
ncbi:conserved protein of unknown function,might belong to TadE family protein [Shewanella benthica]|uniref:TadE-like domain-containing protein n=1 Tax=Shewanella benthica TaxID=43661 RepID=A0A330M5Z8_9GAMM|nr:TadE family protein [Shewanella benthica]SQH76814.1 conserved protein of unknown function,might belong to TadE family protein [Shewanella benthica]